MRFCASTVLTLTSTLISLVYADSKCYLSSTTSNKAFPSLIRCYKSNQDACCVSGHDNSIASFVTGFLSPSCDRRFDDLEFYFCVGCHTDQPMATNSTAKTLTLCKSYVERVWGTPITSPSTQYDNCGFSVGGNIYIPSTRWSSAQAFFDEVKPPFFEDFTIVIGTDDNNCYNSSKAINCLWYLVIAFALFYGLFF